MELKAEIWKKFATHFLYVGCLIGGIIFSLDTAKSYLSFNTSFMTIMEPLLIEDAPVISICYQRGKDPNIKGRVDGEISPSLELSITDVLMGKYAMRKAAGKLL